jgi:hypothetical protein
LIVFGSDSFMVVVSGSFGKKIVTPEKEIFGSEFF